jgi:hypothetical protein
MNKQLKSMQKHKILNVKNHKIFNYSELTIVHEWLLKQRIAQKSRMTGDPAHRKRVLRKISTQPMKILNFLILPCKKLANQKRISSRCEYLSKINQGSRPTGVSTGFLLFTLFLQCYMGAHFVTTYASATGYSQSIHITFRGSNLVRRYL